MELTPGIVIIAVVVVALAFLLIRAARRSEAAAPVDTPVRPQGGTARATRIDGASEPLVQWLLDRAHEQTGVRVADDALARERIAQAAAKALEDLRAGDSATVSLPFLAADAQGPKHFGIRFERNPDSTFELLR